MCFPWVCRTILKWRLKRARPACGSGRQFSENARAIHHRVTLRLRSGQAPTRTTPKARPRLSLWLCDSVVKDFFMIDILERGSGVTFAVTVNPRASNTAITGQVG